MGDRMSGYTARIAATPDDQVYPGSSGADGRGVVSSSGLLGAVRLVAV